MTNSNVTADGILTPVGVWTGEVRHDDQADPYFISFAADGTIALRTPITVGTGTWSSGQPGQFSYELAETFLPASGRAGRLVAHVKSHLDGTTHQGVGTAEIYTPDGVLVHSATAEFVGERIGDEPAAWHDVVTVGASIRGRTLHPGDEGFDEANSGYLLNVEHRPAAIVEAADADDVAAAIRFAATAGRAVAVELTGHGRSVAAQGSVLVATAALRELSVDPQAATARIGAGLRWGDVLDATAAHGLAPLCGSSARVGVMGYLTGGGLPLTSRTHGFAADFVRSVELVTADGRIRTLSAEQDPDLFWAVRGGKGNFGVVTAAEIDLVPLPTVYAGELWFPGDEPGPAAQVVRAYLAWAEKQPDEMSSSVSLVRLPDVPQLPEQFRGRSFLQVHIVYTGDQAQGDQLVEPLRALEPTTDTCATMPFPRITEIHHDPAGPVMLHYRSALLSDLDDAAVEELVSFIDPAVAGDSYPGIELRHLGGALNHPPAHPHAASTQEAAFHLWMRVAAPAGQAETARRTADGILDRLHRWDTGAKLPGFLFDHDADPDRVRQAYTEPNYRRLTELKAEYDPQNLFRANHNIPPLGSAEHTRA